MPHRNWRQQIKKAGRAVGLLLLPLLAGGMVAGGIWLFWGTDGRFSVWGVYSGILVLSFAYCKYHDYSNNCGLEVTASIKFWLMAFVLVLGRSAIWISILPVSFHWNLSTFWEKIFYFLFVGLSEELYFHGFSYEVVLSATNKRKALLLTPLIFAILHFVSHPNLLWLPLWYSISLAYLSLRVGSHSLYPGVVAHAVIDIITSVLLQAPSEVPDMIAVWYLIVTICFNGIFVLVLTKYLPMRKGFETGN